MIIILVLLVIDIRKNDKNIRENFDLSDDNITVIIVCIIVGLILAYICYRYFSDSDSKSYIIYKKT